MLHTSILWQPQEGVVVCVCGASLSLSFRTWWGWCASGVRPREGGAAALKPCWSRRSALLSLVSRLASHSGAGPAAAAAPFLSFILLSLVVNVFSFCFLLLNKCYSFVAFPLALLICQSREPALTMYVYYIFEPIYALEKFWLCGSI